MQPSQLRTYESLALGVIQRLADCYDDFDYQWLTGPTEDPNAFEGVPIGPLQMWRAYGFQDSPVERAIDRVAFYLTQPGVEAVSSSVSEMADLFRETLYQRLETVFQQNNVDCGSSFRLASFLRTFRPGSEFWVSILEEIRNFLEKRTADHVVLVPHAEHSVLWSGRRAKDVILSQEIISNGVPVPWASEPLWIPEELDKTISRAPLWQYYSIKCSSKSLAYRLRELTSLEDAITRVVCAVWFQEGSVRYRLAHHTLRADIPSIVLAGHGVRSAEGLLKRDVYILVDHAKHPEDPAQKIVDQLQSALMANSGFLGDLGRALRAVRASLEVEEVYLRMLLLCCSLESIIGGERGTGRDVRVQVPFLLSRVPKHRREYDQFLRAVYRQRNSVAHRAASEVELGDADKLFWLAANTIAYASIFAHQYTGPPSELRNAWLQYLDGLRFGDSELMQRGDQALDHFEDYE